MHRCLCAYIANRINSDDATTRKEAREATSKSGAELAGGASVAAALAVPAMLVLLSIWAVVSIVMADAGPPAVTEVAIGNVMSGWAV